MTSALKKNATLHKCCQDVPPPSRTFATSPNRLIVPVLTRMSKPISAFTEAGKAHCVYSNASWISLRCVSSNHRHGRMSSCKQKQLLIFTHSNIFQHLEEYVICAIEVSLLMKRVDSTSSTIEHRRITATALCYRLSGQEHGS